MPSSSTTKGMSKEITRLKNVCAALQMKYDRDVESLRLAAARNVSDQSNNQSIDKSKDDDDNDLNVVALLADKLNLENQLKEVRAIEKARKSAFDELELKIIDVARKSLGGQHARTRNGKTIDPSEALAKELIATKIAVSEAQRKMRVMARTEIELRESLERREQEREEKMFAMKNKRNPHVDHINNFKSSQKEDTSELIRQLAEKESRVKSLEREMAFLAAENGGGTNDVDVRSLYDQVAEGAEREKKYKMELLTTKSELKSLRETLDQFVNGSGSSAGSTGNARKAQEKAIDARIMYLEKALETSETQRRRLEKRISSTNKRSSSGSGGGDEALTNNEGISGGRRSGDEKIIGKGGYDGVRSRENSSNSSSRGGGNAGGEKRKYDVSSRHGGEDLQKELDDALDHVKRLQIEKRQNERDVNNLKNEL
jgi:hypothetical protein